METSVFKIEKNDINRPRYIKTMNSWNKYGNYKINKDALLYAIAFGDLVLGGASVIMDKKVAKVIFLNNSTCHEEEIEKDGTIQLSNLLQQEYGSIDTDFQYVKR